jgi:hypothetical protein
VQICAEPELHLAGPQASPMLAMSATFDSAPESLLGSVNEGGDLTPKAVVPAYCGARLSWKLLRVCTLSSVFNAYSRLCTCTGFSFTSLTSFLAGVISHQVSPESRISPMTPTCTKNAYVKKTQNMTARKTADEKFPNCYYRKTLRSQASDVCVAHTQTHACTNRCVHGFSAPWHLIQ